MCIKSYYDLDERGNSARGVEFCIRANKRFKWSIFDRLVSTEEREEMTDLRKKSLERKILEKEKQKDENVSKRKWETEEDDEDSKKRKL